jgi:hypothetical protein
MFLPKIALLLAVSTAALSAEQAREPGAMLREGHWVSDVGAYSVPQALESIKPANWPVDGWYRLTLRPREVLVESAPSTAGPMPDFLRPIVTVLEAQAALRASESPSLSDAPEAPDRIYLRVPQLRLPLGSAEAYLFRNGTTSLRPILDNRYELQLGQRAFAFTVHNGLRGRNGEAYGSGAQYTIEYDGNTYEYSLGEFGWDSTITAIADLDGDGKPDFIISVGGNNSGIDAVLLSSQAKPGKNPPTASLFQIGC